MIGQHNLHLPWFQHKGPGKQSRNLKAMRMLQALAPTNGAAQLVSVTAL
jgi:hypothetical protein